VGAGRANLNGKSNVGKSYVVFGKTNGNAIDLVHHDWIQVFMVLFIYVEKFSIGTNGEVVNKMFFLT
jgi:hypothetical protein